MEFTTIFKKFHHHKGYRICMHKGNFQVGLMWWWRWRWFTLVMWLTKKSVFSPIQGRHHYWRFSPFKISDTSQTEFNQGKKNLKKDFVESTYSVVIQVHYCTIQLASTINLDSLFADPFQWIWCTFTKTYCKEFHADSRNLVPN